MGKGQAPKDYKKIRAQFPFDAKQDGRNKYILLADGHLTYVLLSSGCSGVVSLRVVRLVIFLAELDGLESWGTGVGNDSLVEFAKEKICIVTSPEFGPLEGHNLIIVKALCRLRTSSPLWYERLSDFLRDTSFEL